MDTARRLQVLDWLRDVSQCPADETAPVLARHMRPDAAWHGPHPFVGLEGPSALSETFWAPLKQAIPDLERRDDIFMAGTWESGHWIATMGHLVGTFVRDWLAIPATGHVSFIRFGEFHRVEDQHVVETRVLYDLVELMDTAGVSPLPPALGTALTIPGPATHDGMQLSTDDPQEGTTTVDLVERMLYDGLGARPDDPLNAEWDIPESVLARFWHPDMMWYGPGGTGTTRGIDGFKRRHQIPFRYTLTDRHGGQHRARIAEGAYAASTGWPSYRTVHGRDGWLGLPATGRPVNMRVMDFWRREGNLLVENWVFIDMLDVLEQMGHDALARLRWRRGLG